MRPGALWPRREEPDSPLHPPETPRRWREGRGPACSFKAPPGPQRKGWTEGWGLGKGRAAAGCVAAPHGVGVGGWNLFQGWWAPQLCVHSGVGPGRPVPSANTVRLPSGFPGSPCSVLHSWIAASSLGKVSGELRVGEEGVESWGHGDPESGVQHSLAPSSAHPISGGPVATQQWWEKKARWLGASVGPLGLCPLFLVEKGRPVLGLLGCGQDGLPGSPGAAVRPGPRRVPGQQLCIPGPMGNTGSRALPASSQGRWPGPWGSNRPCGGSGPTQLKDSQLRHPGAAVGGQLTHGVQQRCSALGTGC